MKKFIFISLLISIFSGCGSSQETDVPDTHEGAVIIRTLVQIPTVSELLTVSETTDSSVNIPKEVSGTPPYAIDIDETNMDEYFWNGLLSEITADGEITSIDQADGFWQGLGACNALNSFVHSFSQVEDINTMFCFFKNMPNYPGAVELVEVPDGLTLSNVFDQDAEDRLIKSEIESGGTIYIKIYGSNSSEGEAGYAVDLWECSQNGEDILEYKKIRINSDERIMTENMYNNIEESEGSEHAFNFIGFLRQDEEENVIFDPDETHTIENVYTDSNESSKENFEFLGSKLSAKYKSIKALGDDPAFQYYTVSKNRYSGTSIATVRFLYNAFAEYSPSSPEYVASNAVEYQDDHYEYVGPQGNFYDEIADYDFNGDP